MINTIKVTKIIFVIILFLVYSNFSFASNDLLLKKVNEIKDVSQDGLELATFAGGCFWCMEAPFEKVEGVMEVVSGYSGGTKTNPTYKEVSAGRTNHLESIQILYDPQIINYEELLDVFWRQIDPTDAGGQFVDRGKQYGTTIFYHTNIQKQLAEESWEKLDASGIFKKSIVTEIKSYTGFY